MAVSLISGLATNNVLPATLREAFRADLLGTLPNLSPTLMVLLIRQNPEADRIEFYLFNEYVIVKLRQLICLFALPSIP